MTHGGLVDVHKFSAGVAAVPGSSGTRGLEQNSETHRVAVEHSAKRLASTINSTKTTRNSAATKQYIGAITLPA